MRTALTAIGLLAALSVVDALDAQAPAVPAAARVDPYIPKPRIVVITDIAIETDDQMSMVRYLV